MDSTVLIRQAEVAGSIVDVFCDRSIVAMAPELPMRQADIVLEADGAALLPGLHDHHLHFFAAARARGSVDFTGVGPDDAAAVRLRLSAAEGSGWLRGVGYHESMAGDLDRHGLDDLIADRPARLQHSSGKMWLLNSAAIAALQVEALAADGVERDQQGRATGRLFRMDDWLRHALGETVEPDTRSFSRELAALGVTSFTDASYTNTSTDVEGFKEAFAKGDICQRVTVMGDDSLAEGHLKVMLDESDPPDVDALADRIRAAHLRQRPVAFHCVSRVELLIALSALDAAGCMVGDRIEHGAIIGEDMLNMLRNTGCTVVTQPGFIAQRGERYRREVSATEHEDLYRYQTLLDAGIGVAASSDAPYGPLSPWKIIAAAVARKTEGGGLLGVDEAVSAAEGLRGYLSPPHDPAGPARSLRIDDPADLCLIDRNMASLVADPGSVRVRATLIAGRVVYNSSASTS